MGLFVMPERFDKIIPVLCNELFLENIIGFLTDITLYPEVMLWDGGQPVPDILGNAGQGKQK